MINITMENEKTVTIMNIVTKMVIVHRSAHIALSCPRKTDAKIGSVIYVPTLPIMINEIETVHFITN